MRFNKALRRVVLQKRYQRFLADVTLDDGSELTAHCPNTGAMTGCAEPGFHAWLSDSENPKRKYRYTLEYTENSLGQRICVNTQHANTIAGEALAAGHVSGLNDLAQLVKEKRYGLQNSRIDWFATDATGRSCFIEVKSVTLAQEDGLGCFPDTVSVRAHKHIQELQHVVAEGHRGIVLYVAMHEGIERVQAASHIDATYGELCQEAKRAGVEFFAIKAQLAEDEIRFAKEIPVIS